MIGGNVTDFESVRRAARGCDVVFNCAYDFAGDREEQKRSSLQGARSVGEAVLAEGVRRMVHLSTFSVYAPTQDGDLTETCPWPKSNHYYVSIKRDSERLLMQMHKAKGLPVVMLQPTLVYGPFSPHWTVAMTQQLTSGIVPLVNGGTGYCNPLYIDDLIEAMILGGEPTGHSRRSIFNLRRETRNVAGFLFSFRKNYRDSLPHRNARRGIAAGVGET